jgi:hypothetical protein
LLPIVHLALLLGLLRAVGGHLRRIGRNRHRRLGLLKQMILCGLGGHGRLGVARSDRLSSWLRSSLLLLLLLLNSSRAGDERVDVGHVHHALLLLDLLR